MSSWRPRLLATMAACTLLSVTAMPTEAAFTASEQTELLRLVSGVTNVGQVMRFVSVALRNGTSETSQDPVADALMAASAASREAQLAYGLLLNVVVEQRGGSSFTHTAALARQGRVALAWFRLDRCFQFLDATESALTRALRANGLSAYQDRIRRARDIWLANARHDLGGVNRSLSFSHPNPLSYPKIIGPHGSYDDAQWFLWRANWYALDMLDALATTYGKGPATGDFWPIYKAVNSASLILDRIVRAQGVLAGMSFTADQASLDPFFRVLDELRTITVESSERYMEIQTSLAAWVPRLVGEPTSDALSSFSAALVRLTDSWREVDHAVWEHLVFLDCTNPAGCGGR